MMNSLRSNAVSFVTVYSIYFGSRAGGKDLTSFVTEPDKGIIFYLYSGDSAEITPETYLEAPDSVVGALPSRETERYRSRRLDAVILPFKVLANDPTKLMLGLGIGNASGSVSRIFAGQYAFLAEENVIYASISSLVWEVGVLGLILYLVFFYFIYRDSHYLSKYSQQHSLVGALALGWIGVTVIIFITLPYKDIFKYESLCALYWYFSGYVASKAYALKRSTAPHTRAKDPSAIPYTPRLSAPSSAGMRGGSTRFRQQ
jgi:hypothetical protein